MSLFYNGKVLTLVVVEIDESNLSQSLSVFIKLL